MPALPYTTGIPNPPNAPSVDVPNMKDNTNSIKTFLEYDHVQFNQNFPGTHQQVNLLETNTGGTPTFPPNLPGPGFDTLYATTNSSQIGGLHGELYYTRGGSGIQIQLTGPGTPNPSAAAAMNNVSNGYTFLPGGILLQWGESVSFAGTNVLVITFPQTFRTLLSIVLTGNSTNNGFCISSSTNANFTAKTIGGGNTNGVVLWMAIGN